MLLGMLEYYLGPLRALLLYLFAIFILLTNTLPTISPIERWALALTCITLNLFLRNKRKLAQQNLAAWLLEIPHIHPKAFYHLYFSQLLFLSKKPDPNILKKIDINNVDFRSGKPAKISVWPYVHCAIKTITLANMVMVAFNKFPKEKATACFDALGQMWSLMIADVIHAKISTKFLDGLKLPSEKCILVFNHKSYLDFAINFFALSLVRHANGRGLRPRFIAAKDHFIDNPILYSWMGVGKAIEKAGMIFINRKKGQGWAAMAEAAHKLISSDVEIAVFPQGTRANSNVNAQGDRLDAGFYTTYHPKQWDQPLGHLKLGTAHLILDTAIELKQKPVQILFIGILGTGIAGPKGSFKVQTECEFEFRMGPLVDYQIPVHLKLQRPQQKEIQNETEQNYLLEINKIQELINWHLVENLQFHKNLIQHLKENISAHYPPEELTKILSYLSVHDDIGKNIPFILLDRIFALPAKTWQQYISSFCQLILTSADEPSWMQLLKEVSLHD